MLTVCAPIRPADRRGYRRVFEIQFCIIQCGLRHLHRGGGGAHFLQPLVIDRSRDVVVFAQLFRTGKLSIRQVKARLGLGELRLCRRLPRSGTDVGR
jgi:hypothetical protein